MSATKARAPAATQAQHLAWLQAKADADAVEAIALGKKGADAPQGSVCQERLLLDRFRSTVHAKKVGNAWVNINKHQKKKTDGQRVIRCLLEAATLSNNTNLMQDDYGRSKKDLEELKCCADRLYKYFTDTVERDPTWRIVVGGSVSDAPDLRSVRASLVWMRLFLNSRMNEFSYTFGRIGLTRKAKTARRVNFTVAMSNAMLDIFGRPLDGVVVALAKVFFDTEDLTIYQIKHAREAAALRRSRADAPELHLPTTQISKIIGIKGQIDGDIYRLVLSRRDSPTEQGKSRFVLTPRDEQGLPMPRELVDVVTEICFRPTGGCTAAMSGDFVLRAEEVEPVAAAMKKYGVKAILFDEDEERPKEPPRRSVMHFWAIDDSIKLAKAVRAALDKTAILTG
jgi:hypothetical protein